MLYSLFSIIYKCKEITEEWKTGLNPNKKNSQMSVILKKKLSLIFLHLCHFGHLINDWTLYIKCISMAEA